MTRLFDERERAAENRYAHDEELNFLARRRGVQMLAKWAAETMNLDGPETIAYEARIVDAFVGGMPDRLIVESIEQDLERAGRPTMVSHVAAYLAQATAEASLSLRGSTKPVHESMHEDPREEWSRHHPKKNDSWGWGL